MIRDIMKDETFLSQKAEPATSDDFPVAQDLLDTLAAHRDGCVGMAANMIGVSKRIIVFDNEGKYMVMFNPEIIKKSQPYEAEREGKFNVLLDEFLSHVTDVKPITARQCVAALQKIEE